MLKQNNLFLNATKRFTNKDLKGRDKIFKTIKEVIDVNNDSIVKQKMRLKNS